MTSPNPLSWGPRGAFPSQQGMPNANAPGVFPNPNVLQNPNLRFFTNPDLAAAAVAHAQHQQQMQKQNGQNIVPAHPTNLFFDPQTGQIFTPVQPMSNPSGSPHAPTSFPPNMNKIIPLRLVVQTAPIKM